jgi:hypothetical protein
MISESYFFSTTSEFFAGFSYDGDQMILKWNLPKAVQGSYISLQNYAVKSKNQGVPIRVCCNLVLADWKNPDGCLGDIYHGHGLYSDDMWEMERREMRAIELK